MKLNKFPTSSIKKLISLIELKGNNSSKINYVKTFLSNSKIGLEGISEIENLMKIKNDFTLDFTLARGLSYYTSTIFEVVPKNNDIGSFGYKNISGIGISFGIERIIEVLNTNNLFPKKIESNNNVLISYLSNDLIKNSLKLANKLREKGIPTDLYSEKAKLKKQLQYANNNNIPFVIIIGEDEIKNKKYMLKNMKDGNQNLLTINEIINKMSSIK